MYWSDWGTAAKIEKCGMNGDKSTRKVLIDRDIVWPNGMTIDYKEGRLWWTDARLGTVESTDLNGFDRKITIRSWFVRSSYGITVFGDSIYLGKRSRGRGVIRMDKATGNNWVRMGRKLRAPKEIAVYHRLRQPVPQGEIITMSKDSPVCWAAPLYRGGSANALRPLEIVVVSI